jgi:ABC transporter, phosphonate, periplasmic substrate-binding protein
MERKMSAVAFLPMYAVRGTHDHANTLWSCCRDSMRRSGMDAPDQVAHFESRLEGWLHPDLVLGQTCGLPYITQLCDRVALIGTPDYAVDGCSPGFYHSTLVVSSADRRTRLSDFCGGTLAINSKDSQSGYSAIMFASAPFAQRGRFFRRAIHTRSHSRSMQLVANGLADIAAIDSVTWRMSRQFDSDSASLKSIGTTEPTPGLPFIAAAGTPAERLLAAIRAGVAILPGTTRKAFGLVGVVPLPRKEYEMILSNLLQAEAVHALPDLEEIKGA